MNDYEAERVMAAIEAGKIKKWPWVFYKILSDDGTKFGGLFQVDSDVELAEIVSCMTSGKIYRISEEEYFNLKSKDKEFNPYA